MAFVDTQTQYRIDKLLARINRIYYIIVSIYRPYTCRGQISDLYILVCMSSSIIVLRCAAVIYVEQSITTIRMGMHYRHSMPNDTVIDMPPAVIVRIHNVVVVDP